MPAPVGSDHASFHEKDIPVAFLFTGTHRDYHRPSDDVEKINFEGMARIADLAEVLLLDFARVPSGPSSSQMPQRPEAPGPRERLDPVSLGTIPDYDEERRGGPAQRRPRGQPRREGRHEGRRHHRRLRRRAGGPSRTSWTGLPTTSPATRSMWLSSGRAKRRPSRPPSPPEGRTERFPEFSGFSRKLRRLGGRGKRSVPRSIPKAQSGGTLGFAPATQLIHSHIECRFWIASEPERLKGQGRVKSCCQGTSPDDNGQIARGPRAGESRRVEAPLANGWDRVQAVVMAAAVSVLALLSVPGCEWTGEPALWIVTDLGTAETTALSTAFAAWNA